MKKKESYDDMEHYLLVESKERIALKPNMFASFGFDYMKKKKNENEKWRGTLYFEEKEMKFSSLTRTVNGDKVSFTFYKKFRKLFSLSFEMEKKETFFSKWLHYIDINFLNKELCYHYRRRIDEDKKTMSA